MGSPRPSVASISALWFLPGSLTCFLYTSSQWRVCLSGSQVACFSQPLPPTPLAPQVSLLSDLSPSSCLCLIKLKWCHLAKSSFLGLFGWVFPFSPSGAVMNFLSASLAFPALPSPQAGPVTAPGVRFLAVMEIADGLFRTRKTRLGQPPRLCRHRCQTWVPVRLTARAGARVCVCVCVCVCVSAYVAGRGAFASSSLGALLPLLTLVLTFSLSHFEI